MTNPSEDLLATTEGVDEGSAASTVEGRRRAAPVRPAHGDGPRDVEAEPAPPIGTVATPASGPGQQLEAGEG